MAEAFPIPATPRRKKGTLLAAELAGQQWGVIGAAQLRACGVSESTARRWRREGRLHPLHRAVFALGHPSVPAEGLLVAALLHAGPSAALSHNTAAWWWGLVDEEPSVIEVSSTGRSRSCAGLIVHRRRHLETTRHRRFPVTTLAQTLMDYAIRAPLIDVRLALARADYQRQLDLQAVEAILGQGRAGTSTLRNAFECHEPKLAQTRSRLEVTFIPLCEEAGIATPEINEVIEGWPVDAVWRSERLVVELDGHDNHRSRAQIERDRRKELELRAAGYLVLRYTWAQVMFSPERVAADLSARLRERASLAARSA